MKLILHRLLATVALLLAPTWAHAAITCSISSPGFFSVYDALAPTDNLNQSSYTLNCTRLSSDPTTLNYITFTDDGLYNNGPNNRAKLTTANSFIKYDFFTSSAYATNWSKSQKCIVGSLNFGASLSGSQTTTYYSKVYAAQSGLPQGTYIDTVTVNLAYNRTSCSSNVVGDTSGTFQVQVANVSACQIALPPSTMAFTYTAFSATPAAASTTFSTRCTTSLPYTMTLDSNFGVVSGLNYALTLSATSGSGNGALQNYTINGTMAAGQAGNCSTGSCTATDTRRLTVTY